MLGEVLCLPKEASLSVPCHHGSQQILKAHRNSRSPATSGLGAFQLLGKELCNGSEAVAHAEDVFALMAQDGGEVISDALNLQQQNVMKRMFHVGQLTHQEWQAAPGSLLPRTVKSVQLLVGM